MKSTPFVFALVAWLNAAQFAGAATLYVYNDADGGEGTLRQRLLDASNGDTKCLTPLYITIVGKSGNNLDLSWLTQPNVT